MPPTQKRGYGRFVELFSGLGLSNRLILDDYVLPIDSIDEEIDYSTIDEHIVEERNHSIQWLKNALDKELGDMTAEEFILEKIRKKTEAEKDESLRCFYNIDQLGLHKGVSCQAIIDRLPENSYLQQVQGDFDPIQDTPLPYGVLTIKKTTNYFVEVVFSQMTYRTKKPKMFIGNIVNCNLVGWTEFVTKDSLSDVLKESAAESDTEQE